MGTAQLIGKMSNFQKFSGMKPWSKFSTGETTKPNQDDMKIQQDEPTNILRCLKNIYTVTDLPKNIEMAG